MASVFVSITAKLHKKRGLEAFFFNKIWFFGKKDVILHPLLRLMPTICVHQRSEGVPSSIG